ncbi:MAG: hypothetical protein WA815_00305, partial [Terracidiphilus sp.]
MEFASLYFPFAFGIEVALVLRAAGIDDALPESGTDVPITIGTLPEMGRINLVAKRRNDSHAGALRNPTSTFRVINHGLTAAGVPQRARHAAQIRSICCPKRPLNLLGTPLT